MKDAVREVEREVQNLLKLLQMTKIECSADDVECMLKKAVTYVNLKKRLDKLLYQLAFAYVTSDILEKEKIEEMVTAVVKTGFVTEQKWMKAVADALRYRNKIDGVDTRTHVRRVADRLSDGGMI